MTLAIDTDYLTETLRELVQINSINPALVPGAPGERVIADYVTRSLEDLGFEATRLEAVEGRPSVVGRLAGMSGGRTLMLNAHYDTVGVEGMADPFSGAISDGKLFGRGAYDMKGSLAACLAAAKALQEAGIGLGGDLLVAAVADEEHASLGTDEVLQHFEANATIVTEPTELDVCLAHKGFIWFEVEVRGAAAHGSRPDLGLDANLRMGRFLSRLELLQAELTDREPHRFVGPPSLHAGLLHGGTAPSVYAASSRVTIERRTVPGENVRQVSQEIRSILDALSDEDPGFQAELDAILVREPFEVAIDSPIVRHVGRAVERATGEEPIYSGQSPWMDAALIAAHGTDTVIIGPAGQGAHADEEWVDLESLEKLARILAETALEFCG